MISIVQYQKRRGGLILAATLSIVIHVMLAFGLRYAMTIRTALGLEGVEFVDADYNRAILIDFSRGFRYPTGFLGFVAPVRIRSLEEIRREDERRARLERERRRLRSGSGTAEDGDSAAVSADAPAQSAGGDSQAGSPTSAGGAASGIPGGFGRINTAPIRDQIQQR